MTINTYKNARHGFVHLYDRQKEGLGSYDVHYINAYKKFVRLKQKQRIHLRDIA